MNNYESIVLEIQNEAKQFQCDNQNLRQKLSDLITENEQLRLQSQEATNVSFNKFQNDFIAVTDRTILNLQNQILMINKVWFVISACLQLLTIFILLGKGNV